jgi:hypothetical protein
MNSPVNTFRPIARIIERVKSSNYIALLLIILFGLTVRVAVFSGITGGDDLIYTYHIHRFYTGNFEPGATHWSLRLGFILPSLLFTRIFGFNEIALVLFPLICSLINIVLIYAFARLFFSERIALYAAFLLSFFPMDVFLAGMVFLDTPLALMMSAAVFYFIKGEREDKTIYYLVSGICVGWAWLIKETGAYIFLFYIAYIITEKKIRLKYAFVVLAFLSIVVIEGGYYYIKTGNPLYRLSVAQKTHNETIQNNEILILRGKNWFIEPLLVLMTDQEFGFFYYFILPIAAYLLIKRDKKAKLPLIWMIPLMLYTLYGSTSPFHFFPLQRWPRYLAPITLPVLTILAYFFDEKKEWLGNKFSILSTLFLFFTSMFCIFFFNSGPDDSYFVKKIAEFERQNSQTAILIHWKMYNHLAPFLGYRKNNIRLYDFPENKPRPKGSFYYGLEIAEPDKVKNAYIVIPPENCQINPRNHTDWKFIRSIQKSGKFYCGWLEHSFLLNLVSSDAIEHFCPSKAYEIYYIP